ncbi:hypothetical protein CRG98_025116 [Punica granatum]|uniref:Uncharacterized protein n=1 Tax=Punica granatum TaxID=22663 RepID=A0A2I0JEC6_PUNGR|nr:hypothetical protein CRG98_025116 [Punica granatum]
MEEKKNKRGDIKREGGLGIGSKEEGKEEDDDEMIENVLTIVSGMAMAGDKEAEMCLAPRDCRRCLSRISEEPVPKKNRWPWRDPTLTGREFGSARRG